MKQAILLLVFFTLSLTLSNASHIVGGEFELVYRGRGYVYQVNLNMYFDELNANAGLEEEDQEFTVSIFRKDNNARVTDVTMRRYYNATIPYKPTNCTDVSLVVRTKLFKSTGIVDLTGFDDPDGYYISWERCCRNYQTLNIVHTDFFGNYISGQVFYLEFPPVEKLGVRFINSSPVFQQLLTQYLCKDNINTLDFSGIDRDGDSLVYRMVTPMKGHTSDLNAAPPRPFPGPYDSIDWAGPPYSANNAIPGSPSLHINKFTGVLTVQPTIPEGIYAFAVAIDEYRDGVKIGEIRRDFQYLVKECDLNYSPSVSIGDGNDGSSTGGGWGSGSDTLLVKLNRDTCYSIYVADSNTFVSIPPGKSINRNQNVSIYYGKTSLPQSVIRFSPPSVLITPSDDTVSLNMCFSTCDRVLIEKDSVYFLDIVVNDNTCPSKTDTLRKYIYVDVDDFNEPPRIGHTLLPQTKVTTYPDSLLQFTVYAADSDFSDIDEITVKGDGFKLPDFGMQFDQTLALPDSLAYLFQWRPDCDDIFQQTDYRLTFTVKDKSCIPSHEVITKVKIHIEDVETGLENISPPNLVTANSDSLNDCFYIPDMPPDNCTYFFKEVAIFNSWGARVFLSKDRNFRWCPDNVVDGMYYYGIDLNKKFIRGWVQVIR